jgi:hypothetical protein
MRTSIIIHPTRTTVYPQKREEGYVVVVVVVTRKSVEVTWGASGMSPYHATLFKTGTQDNPVTST